MTLNFTTNFTTLMFNQSTDKSTEYLTLRLTNCYLLLHAAPVVTYQQTDNINALLYVVNVFNVLLLFADASNKHTNKITENVPKIISKCELVKLCNTSRRVKFTETVYSNIMNVASRYLKTRGQSNLTKSASRGAHSPVRGHPRGSKVVPLNSWGRISY